MGSLGEQGSFVSSWGQEDSGDVKKIYLPGWPVCIFSLFVRSGAGIPLHFPCATADCKQGGGAGGIPLTYPYQTNWLNTPAGQVSESASQRHCSPAPRSQPFHQFFWGKKCILQSETNLFATTVSYLVLILFLHKIIVVRSIKSYKTCSSSLFSFIHTYPPVFVINMDSINIAFRRYSC